MKIRYSKAFIKSASKLTGKYKASLKNKIEEVKMVSFVDEITGCSKLEGFIHTYRIRIGDYRVFFIFRISENTAVFEYLISRGDAYNKEYLKSLGKKEKG